jgi:hypothetical protein
VRTSVLFMAVVAAGCAVDAPVPIPSQHVEGVAGSPVIKEIPEDVCTLAALLPSGDICAMMCNPDAMKAQLRAEGEPAGTCLEFSCGLPDDSRVIVGVCLPPE